MLGLSLYQLAEMTGYRVEAISKMERGHQKIKEKHDKVLYPLLSSECLKRVEELKKRNAELFRTEP